MLRFLLVTHDFWELPRLTIVFWINLNKYPPFTTTEAKILKRTFNLHIKRLKKSLNSEVSSLNVLEFCPDKTLWTLIEERSWDNCRCHWHLRRVAFLVAWLDEVSSMDGSPSIELVTKLNCLLVRGLAGNISESQHSQLLQWVSNITHVCCTSFNILSWLPVKYVI